MGDEIVYRPKTARSSNGLGRWPLTPVIGVRLPYALLDNIATPYLLFISGLQYLDNVIHKDKGWDFRLSFL